MPDPTEAQQARRDHGPLTARGEARKQALLAAARRDFERRGYADTTIATIVAEARVSRGTFYTYFDTKDAVFAAIARDVVVQIMAALASSVPSADLTVRVHDLVRRFVAAYRPHARMLGLLEQASSVSTELRDLRLEARTAFTAKTLRGIERLQASGAVDSQVDAEYAAEVLGTMLEYSCYLWFCLDKAYDEQRLVNALARTWVQTLRGGSSPAGSGQFPIDQSRADQVEPTVDRDQRTGHERGKG